MSHEDSSNVKWQQACGFPGFTEFGRLPQMRRRSHPENPAIDGQRRHHLLLAP